MESLGLSRISYTESDLKYQIDQFRQEALEHPEDADYDALMIACNEREIAIMKEHPGASSVELAQVFAEDPALQELTGKLNATRPASDYYVTHGFKMFAPK